MVSCPSGSFFRRPIRTEDVINLFSQTNQAFELSKPEQLTLEGVCDSRRGGHRQLVFSSVEHYSRELGLSESLILIDEFPLQGDKETNQFVRVSDPRGAYIILLEWLASEVGVDAHRPGFGLQSSISKDAQISRQATIETGVEIGAGSIVCAGAVIKTGTRIGQNTVIRENAVIGSDGVTVYRAADARLLKFPHVGGVVIGDNTEVGANTVIAEGILAPSSIGDDVVIGSLCNIGHGAIIGNGVWMSVGSLIGGHTTIQSGATIAMGVSIRDNLVIGEQASLGMGCVVVKDVAPGHSMFGNPAKRLPGLTTGPKR